MENSTNAGNIGFYCSSTSWGGLEMNFVRYAHWLSEEGWNIKVYCVEDSPVSKKVQELKLPFTFVKKNRKYLDIQAATKISKLFKKDEIKLCWIRDTRDFSTIGWAKTLSGKKFKVVYQQAMQLGVRKKDFVHTQRFSKIDVWIAPLNFLAEQVAEMTKFPKARVRIIPLAIDTDKMPPHISKNEARKLLRLPDDRYIMGIVGRIDPLKGQLFAIKALKKIREKDPTVELLIVGEPTLGEGEAYLKILQETVDDLELNQHVHFRPFLKAVNQFYNAVDLTLMTSKGETFGMVTIESMGYGTPVLGTNASGTPEILDYGKQGYLYEVEDQNSFCEQLVQIKSNPAEAQEKATLAQKAAQNKFSRKAVCAEINQLLLQELG